ncbi:hypothetical protein D9M68_814550 [compost metagenome]
MLTLLGQFHQVFGHGSCAVIASRPRQHMTGPHVLPDIRLRVRVVFRVANADGHVHHLTQGGIAKCTVLQLGDVVADLLLRIDPALLHQHRRQGADEGLGHRHGDVLALSGQGAKVALIDHASAVEDENAIGVISLQ